MTDEEIAKEYVTENGFENDCNNITSYEANSAAEQAFLAGLKVGNTIKWHKVSEQIPTEEKFYLIKFKDGTVDVMWIALDGDLEPYIVDISVDFYRDVEKWCEIPEDKE